MPARTRTTLLAALALLTLAGCGTETTPRAQPNTPTTATSVPAPQLPSGYTTSCPPLPPPTGGTGMHLQACAIVPEPCTPQPCGGTPTLTIHLTDAKPWRAPDSGPGYQLRWRITNRTPKTVIFSTVDILDTNHTSIVDQHRSIRNNCGPRVTPGIIPAHRTITGRTPECVPIHPGSQPHTASFNISISAEPNAPQTNIDVPLTR